MLSNTQPDTSIIELKTNQELESLLKTVKNIQSQPNPKGIVVLCCASWYEPCNVLKDSVMLEMSKKYKNLVFTWIDCDQFVDLVDKYQVETAPTVLIFHPHKDDVDKIVNPSPELFGQEIEKANEYYSSLSNIKEEIEEILNSAPMVGFIKGTPTEPKCKFTRRLLGHFNQIEVTFKHFNILENEKIRAWVKVYSNWKTYPQVYINGEFVGGIDVVSELVEEGEFIDMVPQECKKLPPVEVFEQMLGSFDVVVLIDGLPYKTSNTVSESMIKTLDDNSIKYVTVDYLSLEDQVKDHIKTTYNVSESPYIFLKKVPFGNEEVLLKVINEGALETTIPEGSRKLSLNDRLKKLINSSAIMVFIKGTPDSPECGFSRTIIEILRQYDYPFGYFNIYSDDEVRNGLKKYSNWQTYPQLYVKGKFIGGVDVIKELHEEHELEDEFKLTLA